MSTPLAISLFGHKQDNEPKRGETTWEDLLGPEGLAKVAPVGCSLAECPPRFPGESDEDYAAAKPKRECPHKNVAMWSPATWPLGATRAVATVEAVSLLVVDVDHLKTDDELIAICERLAPWKHALHGSHSDRPDDRCVRVLLAFSRPVTAREFTTVRAAVLEMLDLPGDRRAADASRAFYLPARPSDACGDAFDGTGFLFYVQDGKVLDVEAILALADDFVEPPGYDTGPTEFVMPEFAGAPSPEKFEEAAQIMGQAWPDDDRHPAQLALAGALARAGWPVDLISRFCARVAQIDEPGNPKHVNLAPAAARSSYDKARAGHNVAGWPTVIEYVGEDAVARTREALGIAGTTLPPADPSFVAQMAIAAETVRAEKNEPPPAPAPTLSSIDLKASLRSAQKKLASRKDPGSLRDAELLKRVLHGDFLTDDANEDRATVLAYAALAVARAAPPSTTDEQMVRELQSSSGPLAPHLRECVAEARKVAAQMPPLLSRSSAGPTGGVATPMGEVIGDFVVMGQGTRQGRPDNGNQHNVRVALHRMGITLRHNAFTMQDEMTREGVKVVVEDKHLKTVRNEMERIYDLKPSKDDLWDTVEVIAHESAYHPVREYFDGLPESDLAEDLTETWLIRYGGAPDTLYVRAVSRLVLVAAVRRVRQPGCKFDEMLILESPQGKNKSTALKIGLCPDEEWFTDDFDLDDDDKKNIEQTSGKWIVEAGELSGMSKGDHTRLKRYMSKTRDRARMAYARKPQEFPRQFIIIGTTNEKQYLKDQTGNRRYWPVNVVEFDIEGLVAVRDRLWAEAARLERENPDAEFIRLDPSLYDAARREQERREVDSPYKLVLEDALGGATGRILISDAWKLCGCEGPPNTAVVQQIAQSMYAMGFEKMDHLVGGHRKNYYQRGEGPALEIPLRLVGTSGDYKVVAGHPTGTGRPPMTAADSPN